MGEGSHTFRDIGSTRSRKWWAANTFWASSLLTSARASLQTDASFSVVVHAGRHTQHASADCCCWTTLVKSCTFARVKFFDIWQLPHRNFQSLIGMFSRKMFTVRKVKKRTLNNKLWLLLWWVFPYFFSKKLGAQNRRGMPKNNEKSRLGVTHSPAGLFEIFF